MAKISRNSLLKPGIYAAQRQQWRDRVIPFKKLRTVHIGKHATVLFENELTIRYQLQEMIRVDKSMEQDALHHELAVYNALLPEQRALKATLLLEFVDADIRDAKLAQLQGIEHAVWIKVDGHPPVHGQPVAGLDDRHTDRAASVYFLSFQLSPQAAQDFIGGEAVAMGIDHPAYRHTVDEISPETQVVLMEDLK
ncbi:DUF3501 family protein [Limnobacter humi]|uniref:DUF3501 family protein n=1 Tax=Limnobacter humi TaxID=1778671 RepID=A0ABT1WI28_9BURK|nr:DUF3501 family protein [Limnobacter humi]MCQ8897180.1 DUF3501 family protein [Limnobacter humi]